MQNAGKNSQLWKKNTSYVLWINMENEFFKLTIFKIDSVHFTRLFAGNTEHKSENATMNQKRNG